MISHYRFVFLKPQTCSLASLADSALFKFKSVRRRSLASVPLIFITITFAIFTNDMKRLSPIILNAVYVRVFASRASNQSERVRQCRYVYTNTYILNSLTAAKNVEQPAIRGRYVSRESKARACARGRDDGCGYTSRLAQVLGGTRGE